MPFAHGSGTLSKKGFAELIGLSPGRVSQLIEQGLPVEANGRIDPVQGRRWYLANTDPGRRRAGRAEDAARSPRAELDRIRAERAALQLARERSELVDRGIAERAVFARARAERDAWIGWASRASAQIAAETEAEPAALFAALDRLVREQLETLARLTIDELAK